MATGIQIYLNNKFERKIEKRFRNAEILTRKISEKYMYFIRSKFVEHGIPPWRPLAPSTIKQRMRKGYGAENILIRTDQMESSIQPFFDVNAGGAGTNNPYARTHEQPENWGNPNAVKIINIPAHERVINFKKYRSSYTNKKTGKRRGAGSVRFSREKKASFAQKVFVKARTITIPRRSFLELRQEEKEELGKLVIQFLNE